MSFGLAGGIVLARFSAEARPVAYLLRPFVAVVAIAAVIGAVSLIARRFDVLLAAGLTVAVLIPLSLWTLLVPLVALAVGLAVKIWDWITHLPRLVVAVSLFFFVGGLVPVVPRLFSMPPAGAAEPQSGVPIYLILLDGYPRADNLDDLGIDQSTFISDLIKRGFDVYPDAYSDYGWTYLTLTNMLTDGYDGPDGYRDADLRASLRQQWRLPDGFVTVAPPSGQSTIPGVRVLNPGGPTVFEEGLLRNSLFAYLPGASTFVADGLRLQLDRSIETISTTDEPRVFAHLLAPHTPFLYDASGNPQPLPPCWPNCNPFDLDLDALGMSLDDWAAGMEGNISFLNDRVIEMIDATMDGHPDAAIVLFSDHGGRYDKPETAEWYETLLAARTPHHPMMFSGDPRPGSIIQTFGNLGYWSE
ncbi:MAG: hypothetical protein IH943_04255 [Acidobacteria bacterium]|nr:hypothetical protein [Acidobacteriota bacterium]